MKTKLQYTESLRRSVALPTAVLPTGQLLWEAPHRFTAMLHLIQPAVTYTWHQGDPWGCLPRNTGWYSEEMEAQNPRAPNSISSISLKWVSVGCSRACIITQSSTRTFQAESVNFRVLLCPAQNGRCYSHVAADHWKIAGPNWYV